MATVNTIIYQQAWENRLAQRLDKPQNWQELNDVVYTDTQIYNFPLISTANEPTIVTVTNTAAGRSDTANVIPFTTLTETNQTLTISLYEAGSVYVDYADQAQSNYAKMASYGDLLGKKMGERIEAISLANHANWTNFGDTGAGVLGLSATQITVTGNNIDDIIRGIKEQIWTANGYDLYQTNGAFIEWRPADWTFLEQFMQANGFVFADKSLKDGAELGQKALGLYHYVSTSHTANHVYGGVRKVQKMGILKSTYGRTYVNEMPSSSTAGSLSGTQIHTRADYGLMVPTNLLPVIFDINVV